MVFLHGWGLGHHTYRGRSSGSSRWAAVCMPRPCRASAAPPTCRGADVLPRRLRPLGRRLPRRVEHRRARLRGRPLLRRRRRHPARPRLPRAGALARAGELDRRLGVASRAASSRRSPSARSGTGASTSRATSGRSPRPPGCCRSCSRTRCPTCCATRGRCWRVGQPRPPGRPHRRARGAEATARCRSSCCGAPATASSRESPSTRCAPPSAPRARWSTASTRGCSPTPTASARSSRTTSRWPSSPRRSRPKAPTAAARLHGGQDRKRAAVVAHRGRLEAR